MPTDIVSVAPMPFVDEPGHPSQYLAVDTPAGRINLGWRGKPWPPPLLILLNGAVYEQTSCSQLDADTVTDTHVMRGALYTLSDIIDPDCVAGKCATCVGGPCTHDCHIKPTGA